MGQPLGAACADDGQCSSGICVKTSVSGMCCDKAEDACNHCVAGSTVPNDGVACGTGSCTGGTTSGDSPCGGKPALVNSTMMNYVCMGGACTAVSSSCVPNAQYNGDCCVGFVNNAAKYATATCR